jgi:Tol biopolymer transport system component
VTKRVGFAGLAAALIVLILAAAPLRAEPARGEGRIVFGFGESGALHPAQLAVMDGDGKHRRLLPLDHVFSVSWSRDGRSIAYDVLTPAARPNTYRRDVWTMNVDGRPRYRRVVRNGERGDWSPNGRELAFVRGGDIWVVDLKDHRQRRIVHHGHLPRWSPDGKKLTFERGGSRVDVWVAELAAKKQRRLVRNGDFADWSPDGRQIVFDRCRTTGLVTECSIHVVRADGTAQRRLFEGEQPLWSPNGQAIAFVGTVKRRGFYDAIVRARLDGSGRRVLFGQRPYCGCYLLAWGPPHRGR